MIAMIPLILMSSLASITVNTASTRPPAIQQRACNRCEAPIYEFNGASSGSGPSSNLVMDASGAFYGLTGRGGDPICKCGAIFKLAPSASGYTESVLYSFKGGADGADPGGDLVMDQIGALYGAAFEGGNTKKCGGGCGTIFKLSKAGSSYSLTVLHTFGSTIDGLHPQGGVAMDSAGNLYGTTYNGGDTSLTCVGFGGCGTVFELKPAGSSYAHSVLYRFKGGADGTNPVGGLLVDQTNALYGTTPFGGNSPVCDQCGSIFRVEPSGSHYRESVVYRFKWGLDGRWPTADLVADGAGNLYGTTSEGGNFRCTYGGCGTVFEVTHRSSRYRETVLYSFLGGGDGLNPDGRLLLGSDGSIYGSTVNGGGFACPTGCGVAYKLAVQQSKYKASIMHRFRGSPGDGGFPGGLIAGADGALYGATGIGGSVGSGNLCSYGCGTVFRLMP